ncbi:MAG: energy-coupling factor transporter transmembrane protein EcfT [Orrella sp.]
MSLLNQTLEVSAKGTWLHRWPAGLKLLSLFSLGTALVLTDHIFILGASAVVASLVCLSVHWPPFMRGSASSTRSSVFLWPLITLMAIVAYIGFVSGFEHALVVLCRLLALLLFAISVMATTSVTAMMAVVEKFLQPFDRWGWIRADKVALMFGISLRLMPVLLEQWHEIREAQAARGHRASPLALLVPMLVRTLQRAAEMADAIDARGGSSAR